MDQKLKERILQGTVWTGAVAATGISLFFIFRHPVAKFESAVQKIASDPEAYVGDQFGFSTYVDDQPWFGRPVTSGDVNDKTVWAFEILKEELEGSPVTYYAAPASMPTQETIWQYPECFVRLYATSSLDSDGAAVGVFPGNYSEFRKSEGQTHYDSNFVPIEFAPPKRFLAGR